MISRWLTASMRTSEDCVHCTTILIDRSELIRSVGRIALVLSSASFLTCSLPELDLGLLAWVSLAPLMIACRRLGPLAAAGLGFIAATAANIGVYRWLFEVKGFEIYHFAILSTFFALYPTLWSAMIPRFARRPLSLLLGPAALWVALDYIRANAGFMAFPWGTLAHTQHQNLAILQVATLAGEYGVTFLVVLGNAAIALLVTERAWRSAVTAVTAIALAHIGGALALQSADSGAIVRLAAVQPSILRSERDTPQGRALVLNRLDRLSRTAAASRPALIAWPETAVSGNLRTDPFLNFTLLQLAQDIGTQIVFGIGEVEKFAIQDAHGKPVRRAYNSAYLLKPGAMLDEPYLKRVLLPFGEYVPLEDLIGWPAWLVAPGFDTVVGTSARVFTLEDGTQFAPLICWENLFASLARESVQNGARLIIVLTNDGWFGRTAEPRQHNLASVLRAVENRVPVVVSSNTGPSTIVDPYGRIVASASGIFTEEVVIGETKLHTEQTLYTRFGDFFVWLVIGGLAVGTLPSPLKKYFTATTTPAVG